MPCHDISIYIIACLVPGLARTKECDALACQEPGEHKTRLELQLKFVNQLETSPACRISEEPTVSGH